MISPVAAFLLARVEEDEDVARRVLANWQRYGVYDDRASPTSAVRLRAECDAKRRIVRLAQQWGGDANDCGQFATCVDILAAVYADHPDYDPAWRLP